MRLSDRDRADLVRDLTPVITTLIQETLRAMGLKTQMSIQFGTIDSVDGADVYVIMDDSEDGVAVQVTRSAAGHATDSRVPILTYPPSGALALLCVPDT